MALNSHKSHFFLHRAGFFLLLFDSIAFRLCLTPNSVTCSNNIYKRWPVEMEIPITCFWNVFHTGKYTTNVDRVGCTNSKSKWWWTHTHTYCGERGFEALNREKRSVRGARGSWENKDKLQRKSINSHLSLGNRFLNQHFRWTCRAESYQRLKHTQTYTHTANHALREQNSMFILICVSTQL